MTPEKTNFRTPATFAASTMPSPSFPSSGRNTGLMWNTPSQPAAATRRLAGSDRSPIAVSSAPRRLATSALPTSRTKARTLAPRRFSSGTTNPAYSPVAPITSIFIIVRSPFSSAEVLELRRWLLGPRGGGLEDEVLVPPGGVADQSRQNGHVGSGWHQAALLEALEHQP